MNSELWSVLGLALLPAAGNFGGGLLAEWLRPSSTTLNRALHASAGIILAVICVEVMPEALKNTSVWILAIAFMLGGMAYLSVEAGIEAWQKRTPGGAGTGAWMVYVAVAADLLGDGLLIGTGSAISTKLAFVLAIGQVLADIPEGFAVIANFRDKGIGRAGRLWIAASFTLPVVIAAALSYFLLRNQSETLKMSALVFVAGLYSLAAVEDMLREAHESAEDSRWSAMSFLAGFALFLIVSKELIG
ncbi:ZIP family metal transporter [Blastopirellula marina]|uniref:Peptidoglycan-binding protein n=1 Tax=Blastopirellula marina TaxID=124 RepID=A0A2S8FTU2_9BACT|nr:peptidoglycan-binding protein [Blastopirellula marina]PQO35605.1 peptidoglycan-binding protein [Blastopirellula marina]PQO46805.1 peptidoglycan-binding protein [Blastopirellula marina]PTL44245.1 peptidoglycan-binding protein [Blastopirellula marina]